MIRNGPIIQLAAPKGSYADAFVTLIAALGLFGAVGATLWFFLGFFETDPGLSPASAALLLSLGLGAFAIIPTAILMRLSWTAWRQGFKPVYGWWSLFLALPWMGLGGLALKAAWLPFWLSLFALFVAGAACLWAVISLCLARNHRMNDRP